MSNLNNIITNMVDSSASNSATAVTPTQTTAIPTPTVPVTDSLRSTAAQGWQCPVCSAVMSPWTSVCVNCHGNRRYTFNQVTCTGSDQVTAISHT